MNQSEDNVTFLYIVTTKNGSRQFSDSGAAERYLLKLRDAKKETYKVIHKTIRQKVQTVYAGSFIYQAGGI